MKFNIFPGLIILIGLIVIVVSVPVVPVSAPMSASANTIHVPARGRVLVHGAPMPARNDSSLPVLKRRRQPRVDIGVELRKRIHFLSFQATLEEFMEARNGRHPMLADWTSDACTSWADRPFKFDFKFACYRHDFGYRNNPPDWELQVEVELMFLRDLNHMCALRRHNKKMCLGIAKLWHRESMRHRSTTYNYYPYGPYADGPNVEDWQQT